MAAAPDRPLPRAFVLHSPSATAARAEHVGRLEALLAEVTEGGAAGVRVVREEEPHDVLPRAAAMVDLDASHVADAQFRPLVRSLHVRQLSNLAKHLVALDAAASGGDDEAFRMVVEDDALFGDRAAETIRAACAAAPPEVGIVFLGLPSPTPAPPAPDAVAFDDVFSVFNLLPSCDAYLVRPRAAAALAAGLRPARMPTNLQLTMALRERALPARICVPNAFVDGSKLGAFVCSLDANPKLFWNQGFCKMEVLLRGGAAPYDAAAQAQFEALLREQPFREHPDVRAMAAAHLARAGRHREAEAAYAGALAAYDAGGAVVNATSEVLRGYAALYEHLQGELPAPQAIGAAV